MFEFYVQIKTVHVCAVALSGSLFLLRAIGAQCGGLWPRSAPVRVLSWTIDSVLLTAALMLATMLPAGVFANGWLGWKLACVAGYVVTGYIALRSDAAPGRRRLGLFAALILFATAASIAHAHDPLVFVRLLAR